MARGTNNNGGHKGLSYTKFGYIFIAPFCIVYTIFSLYPLLTTFWYSVANPKSATADFWGFSNKDAYYDQYLNLMDTSNYANEAIFTEATGLTYDEYQLVKDYFNIQEIADKTNILDGDSLQAIIDLGTTDNGNGISLSQDTLNVIQAMKTQNSIVPISENYRANTTDNAYTDMYNWYATFYDPQVSSQENIKDIDKTLTGILDSASSSDDESASDELDAAGVVALSGMQDIIDQLDETEFTTEQQAIIDDIASKIGADNLKDYFVSVQNGDNSIEDPIFYFAVVNLNNGTSAYNYGEGEEAANGVISVNGTFMSKLQGYLAKNVWANTITSLSTYSNFAAYGSGERSVFDDRNNIMADMVVLNNAGIMVLQSYTVEGTEITENLSDQRVLAEAITLLQSLIDRGTATDAKILNGATAVANMMTYYTGAVYSELNGDGTVKTMSYVDHAYSVKSISIETYISYDGELDLDKYYEYKAAIGFTDILSYDSYVKLDEQKKQQNKSEAEAILATYFEDPAVANYGGRVSTFSLNSDGQLYFDVDVRGKGSDEVVIVEGNTLQEQLDFITPYYNAHLVNDADVINGSTTEEIRDGLMGMGGTDRYDICEAYNFVFYRALNANRQIANPTGVLGAVDSTQKYVFTGSENFKYIFSDVTTRNTVFGSFVTTATLWIMGFIPQILLALILSNWFTDNRLHLKGLNLMKALMYLPNVITAVTIAVFFRRIFSYSSGGSLSASQIILRKLTGHGYNFFTNPWASRWLVAFINFWMWYGNTMIVLIAGITSINESLFESAQIDGANSFQTYTKITLPLLRPILLYTFVSSLIGGLQMYDIPKNIINTSAYIGFNGTKIYSLRTVLMYVNEIAFGAGNNKLIGRASAVSVILFFVTTILSILIFYMMRDKDAAKAAKAKKLARKAGK